ncbi:ligase-associated DNA damage response exonuclease [Fulvivirga sedimenti]|uniref:Ligase-associated DNA damage response exonuclease n=1 Tax=Fulvivirga sedimenti TaxID=2879465 RepID=A0A9X1HMT0_9BACT|nr:ligase-associated DNA damage response exonuclease [Fulvivirga sedimenti]MCA6073703.1 ligase-associated DNA damage response exonuclease [Fulvivirga sedimenti]
MFIFQMGLLEFTEKGIYCSHADVYIDPWKPVKKALITHGHADHSRPGHQYYLATPEAAPIIRYRLGNEIRIQTLPFGSAQTINGVKFSFHPAGHIIGSAQVRVEYKGEVWVVSGDYKLENDGLSTPFEPVPCNVFITECTFGLPIYQWKDQAEVFAEINQWWQENKDAGKVSILTGYALGKAQRLLFGLDQSIGPVFTHGAIENVNEIIRAQGITLPETQRVEADMKKRIFEGSLILTTPSSVGTSWLQRFKPYSVAMASGWMALRGARRRRAADRGFVLSDHADWDGLNAAVSATGASRIITTHGYTNLYSRWLVEQGLDAMEAKTEFEGEVNDVT